jgi:hypothetical protein
MTAKERDEAMGGLLIVAIGMVIYLGVDGDWSWYVTVFMCVAVFLCFAAILAVIDRSTPNPLPRSNPELIKRLRVRQQKIASRSK